MRVGKCVGGSRKGAKRTRVKRINVNNVAICVYLLKPGDLMIYMKRSYTRGCSCNCAGCR